ncbi:MAG: hypothetical protein FJX54_09305 [Alphaproteobacteria bacterium]|nr:hypothetical protein [Alphaproteobacteria bacterium]
MPVTSHDAQRCRERAVAHRRLAATTDDPELRDGYLRLAISYEMLADAVIELDRTESWFAAKLAEPSLGIGAGGVSG